MEAIYVDGRSLLFGAKRGCALHFSIPGPDGERIAEVGILKSFVRVFYESSWTTSEAPAAAASRTPLKFDKEFWNFVSWKRAGDYLTFASLEGMRSIQPSIGVEVRIGFLVFD
ncbi:hypothetical protein BDV06DRAFT_227027 [Aspergillus oleicola]